MEGHGQEGGECRERVKNLKHTIAFKSAKLGRRRSWNVNLDLNLGTEKSKNNR
jgi:hypothetical protein